MGYIINPSSLVIPSSGGVYDVTIDPTGVTEIYDASEISISPNLQGVVTSYEVDGHVSISIQFAEASGGALSGSIVITVIDTEGNEDILTLPVTREAYDPGVTLAIGSPIAVEIPSETEYKIQSEGVEVYRGKAVAEPGQNFARVRLDALCADLLNSGVTLPDASGVVMLPNYSKRVTVAAGTAQNYTLVNSYGSPLDFNDYHILGAPVLSKVDPRQTLLFTVWAEGEDYQVRDANGVLLSGFFDELGAHCLTLKLAELNPSKFLEVEILGKVFRYEIVCGHPYALHFTNEFGGWSSLPMKGHAKRSDKVERMQMQSKQGDSLRTVTYCMKFTPSWSLNTDTLTNEESAKIPALLESPNVLLEDLTTGELIPVNVSGDNVEYKTYENQGKRAYFYTIEVNGAETHTRR